MKSQDIVHSRHDKEVTFATTTMTTRVERNWGSYEAVKGILRVKVLTDQVVLLYDSEDVREEI